MSFDYKNSFTCSLTRASRIFAKNERLDIGLYILSGLQGHLFLITGGKRLISIGKEEH